MEQMERMPGEWLVLRTLSGIEFSPQLLVDRTYAGTSQRQPRQFDPQHYVACSIECGTDSDLNSFIQAGWLTRCRTWLPGPPSILVPPSAAASQPGHDSRPLARGCHRCRAPKAFNVLVYWPRRHKASNAIGEKIAARVPDPWPTALGPFLSPPFFPIATAEMMNQTLLPWPLLHRV